MLAGPSAYWSVNLAVGHDDQILADPEQLGVVSPVSDNFFSGSTRFLFRYTEIFKQDRFDLSADAKGTAYGEKVEGGDGDLSFLGSYRKRLSSSLVVDLAASTSLFRRSEKAIEEPVFDFDQVRLDGRLGWSPGRNWLATGTVIHDWLNFPGRFADEDTAGTIIEEQSQLSLSVSVMRMFSGGQYLSGEIIYRRTTSNARASEFDGPIATVRGRRNLPAGTAVTGFLAYGTRGYDHFLTVDSTDTRNDQTWQIGVIFDRPLSPRVMLFFDVNYFDQLSNVEDFEFDQTRVSLGVAMTLVAEGETPFMLPPVSTLTPVLTKLGVRFHYEDPAAGST